MAQLSFIELALDAPPDVINFGASHLRRVNLGPIASLHRNSQYTTWGCLDLIETLLNLGVDGEHYNIVRKILGIPSKMCPEQLIIGLAEVRPMYTNLQSELLSSLLPMFIHPHKNAFAVLHQIFQVNPQILVNALIDTYVKDRTMLRRILDIAQELKILALLLQSRNAPFRFMIDLATLAAKRDSLNLDHWLNENMRKFMGPFIHECIIFLAERIQFLSPDGKQEQRDMAASSFSKEIAASFFKCLKASSEYAPDFTDQIDKLKNSVNPELMDAINRAGEYHIDPEIERQANEYFGNIFKSALSINDAIELLRRLKSSKKEQDQELFACMIHNLFDEFRFFARYPPAELRIVSELFGALVQHDIVQAKTLKYALYVVLSSLSDPSNTKVTSCIIIYY